MCAGDHNNLRECDEEFDSPTTASFRFIELTSHLENFCDGFDTKGLQRSQINCSYSSNQ